MVILIENFYGKKVKTGEKSSILGPEKSHETLPFIGYFPAFIKLTSQNFERRRISGNLFR
jgi:hypothetical protein